MKILVVYESLWGNTRAIAEAIAEGVRDRAEAAVVPVARVDRAALESVDLVVVGGPTHVHGMTSRMSRRGAVDDARKKGLPEPTVDGTGLREWFDALDPGMGRHAAAFDTRIGKPKILTGSAAQGIAHRLRRHGYTLVGEESFIVDDTAGPLRDGERARARDWGRGLVTG